MNATILITMYKHLMVNHVNQVSEKYSVTETFSQICFENCSGNFQRNIMIGFRLNKAVNSADIFLDIPWELQNVLICRTLCKRFAFVGLVLSVKSLYGCDFFTRLNLQHKISLLYLSFASGNLQKQDWL